MQAVESGEADYAVLPIENSSAGAVSDNYDLLIKYHNYIVAETYVTVDVYKRQGLDWVMEHTVFLHFCGRQKPWRVQRGGRFAVLYKHYMNLAGRIY